MESSRHKIGNCDKMDKSTQWLRDLSIGAWLSSHSHSLFKLWQSVLGPESRCRGRDQYESILH